MKRLRALWGAPSLIINLKHKKKEENRSVLLLEMEMIGAYLFFK
jgi:hypothetical protein